MEKKQPISKILKNKYIPTAEFYSHIIDSLHDYAILTIDKKYILNSWSSGASKIFGYETEEVVGRPFEMIFTEEDRKKGIPKQEMEKVLKEGRATDNRWHLCKDGSTFYAFGLVFPLTGNKGELLGYVKILRDLTEIKKSEEAINKKVKELEELNTHKESILAILSHDLRSPLSSIIQYSELLKDNFDSMSHDDLKRILDIQYESSINELSMLDNLLEWARIKYASEIFSPTQIELVQYVEKVFNSLKEVAVIKTINLHNEIEENTKVFADEKMLISILHNIVSNAIKHSHKGGHITATATIKDDKIIVQIKDTGTGMSKEIQEKLFNPQVNTLSKERKKNKGAGIGLLLVKGFLERNGGEIWVESIEGVGSSFYFTLPIKNPLDKIGSADQIDFEKALK